jgi:hypothetical protein
VRIAPPRHADRVLADARAQQRLPDRRLDTDRGVAREPVRERGRVARLDRLRQVQARLVARRLGPDQQRELGRRHERAIHAEVVAARRGEAVFGAPVDEGVLVQAGLQRRLPRVQHDGEHRLECVALRDDEAQPRVAVGDQRRRPGRGQRLQQREHRCDVVAVDDVHARVPRQARDAGADVDHLAVQPSSVRAAQHRQPGQRAAEHDQPLRRRRGRHGRASRCRRRSPARGSR